MCFWGLTGQHTIRIFRWLVLRALGTEAGAEGSPLNVPGGRAISPLFQKPLPSVDRLPFRALVTMLSPNLETKFFLILTRSNWMLAFCLHFMSNVW